MIRLLWTEIKRFEEASSKSMS